MRRRGRASVVGVPKEPATVLEVRHGSRIALSHIMLAEADMEKIHAHVISLLNKTEGYRWVNELGLYIEPIRNVSCRYKHCLCIQS